MEYLFSIMAIIMSITGAFLNDSNTGRYLIIIGFINIALAYLARIDKKLEDTKWK